MKEGKTPVSKSVPSAGMKEKETEDGEQSGEEGAADRNTGLTDLSLMPPPTHTHTMLTEVNPLWSPVF